ncbi:uncharacterized protein LOC127726246 [Mytilus californianus]|uniref:uncharacterized protein LOC127726246 n=1 Tax=Mytilus californianus TaxID=6549 RepID=UPI00224645A6|nr:uncharacterized protein LOC127726246 [Mytilus californianus]
MGDDLLFVPESSLQQPTTSKRQKLTSTVSFDNLVSHWGLNNLEILGLFYAEKPVDINTLLDKSLSYNSQILHLSPRLKTFITILERFLNFDVSLPDDYSEGEQREDRRARWTNEMEALARCKIEADKVYKYEEVIDNETQIDNDLLCLFDSIMASVREFYNDLKQFMVDSKLNRCTEGSYRELSRAFLKACGLGIRAGNVMNQTFEIGELTVKSVPDLRCCFHSNSSEVNYQVETVLVIGEIKKWKRNWKLLHSMDFRSQHLQPCNVLGQHGGQLLLETNSTSFRIGVDSGHQPSRLVYGAIVIGTQVIFTALEISEQHLTEIENVKTYKGRMENENRTGNSTISYTRPYDYLKASERSLLYESLLRFACYQKGLT